MSEFLFTGQWIYHAVERLQDRILWDVPHIQNTATRIARSNYTAEIVGGLVVEPGVSSESRVP